MKFKTNKNYTKKLKKIRNEKIEYQNKNNT